MCINKENSIVVEETHVNLAHDQRKKKANAFYLLLKERGRPLDPRTFYKKERLNRSLLMDT